MQVADVVQAWLMVMPGVASAPIMAAAHGLP